MTKNFGALALGVVLFLTGCGSSKKAKTLNSVAVTPSSASVAAGTTQQFKATATYSDASTADVTSSATWASSTTSVATINASGLATGVAVGSSNITAIFQSVTSPAATLTVTAPTLTSIAVTPTSASIAAGSTQQFTATATYSDSSTKDVTSSATWTSQTTSVATISSSGLATGVAAGTSNITAGLQGVTSPTATLTVTATAVPLSLQVTPASDTVSVGSTVSYTVVEKLNDGTTRPPTGTVTWSSGATSTATIGNSTGIAIAVAPSTTAAVITATEGTLTGTANLTVSAASARFAFNADGGQVTASGGVLTEWSVDAARAAFTLVTTTAPVSGLQQIMIHPTGHYFYALDQSSNVAQYDINSTTGAVTQDANPALPTVNGGLGVSFGAIDPTGRFLYVVNIPNPPPPPPSYSPAIYSFSINQTNGKLTVIGSPITTNLVNPSDILIDNTGSFAYVVDGGVSAANSTASGPGNIYQYKIDPVTGALTPNTTASVPTGQGANFGAFNPAGTFLYVPNLVDHTISVYSMGTGGLLSAVGTPTVITGSPTPQPFTVAVDPSGQFLYTADNANGVLYGFVLGSNGAIGAATPSSPYAVGNGAANPFPVGITIDPKGVLLVVDNSGSNSMTAFTLNPTTGQLTLHTPDITTGANPQFLSFYSALAGQ